MPGCFCALGYFSLLMLFTFLNACMRTSDDPSIDDLIQSTTDNTGKCLTCSPFVQNIIQKDRAIEVDPGKPLFLTPYLERHDISGARNASMVGALDGIQLHSYSGYFTVDKAYNSNMFFWFVPAQVDPDNDPVILWLSGGPGHSSMNALFRMIGPYRVDEKMKLYPRTFAWTKKYSMLYIDNPVGAGYSFTEKDEGYSNNQTAMSKNLYSAIQQFYLMFPSLEKNGFYIAGESYAGKFIPSIAYYILQQKGINLTGVAIGDGWSDPPSMFPHHADYLYQIGLLDETQRDHIKNITDQVTHLVNQEKWKDAYLLWDTIWRLDPDYFSLYSGGLYKWNIALDKTPDDESYWKEFVIQPYVRKAIHVGKTPFDTGKTARHHLQADMLKPVKLWLAEVMNNYKVMVYNGQLDAMVPPPLTQAMLQTVPWKYLEEYKQAKRTVWKVADHVAGYYRNIKDFYQVVIRNAGHIVPYDQPEWAFNMIDRFISGIPFTDA